MARGSIVVCMSKGAGYGFYFLVSWYMSKGVNVQVIFSCHDVYLMFTYQVSVHPMVWFLVCVFFPPGLENLKIQNMTHQGFELATFRLPMT